MISGFNSDIDFQGTIYHVQTEDKGLGTPIILSLVYSRGEILASKRSPYDDLIAVGFDETELNDRLQRQHKLIIAAIRAGRIDDLKRMSMKEQQKRRPSKANEGVLDIPLVDDSPQPVQQPQTPAPELQVPPPALEEQPLGEKPSEIIAETPAEEAAEEIIEEKPEVPAIPADVPVDLPAEVASGEPEPAGIPISMPPAAMDAAPIPRPPDDLIEIPIDVIEEPLFDDVEILEYGEAEETILPAEAVKIITEHVGAADEDDDRLKIRLLGRSTFYGGEDATLDVLVARGGKLGRGLSKVLLVIKVLGSTFRPQIYHARADDNGIAKIQLQIPEFKTGRAALLIKAIHEEEEIELRHVITRR